jgi:hypothetical protein
VRPTHGIIAARPMRRFTSAAGLNLFAAEGDWSTTWNLLCRHLFQIPGAGFRHGAAGSASGFTT